MHIAVVGSFRFSVDGYFEEETDKLRKLRLVFHSPLVSKLAAVRNFIVLLRRTRVLFMIVIAVFQSMIGMQDRIC